MVTSDENVEVCHGGLIKAQVVLDGKLILGKQIQERSVLPFELLVLIAQFLAGHDAYGTLASLNSTCNMVREETLPILWETVILVSRSGASYETESAGWMDLLAKRRKLIR